MKRLEFITAGILSLPSVFLVRTDFISQSEDPLPDSLVNDFVRAGHNDLEAVRQMLTQTPSLLNASWDWGAGDFESALGGASHMGNRAIAEFLLSSGARADVFTYAMLGKVEVVKEMVSLYPALLTSKGPHGISLYRHAEKGGEMAGEMLEFLKENGLTE